MKDHQDTRKDLIIALQRGIPLVRRPWDAMEVSLGVTADAIQAAGRDLFARGVARRFGAVFDSSSLGYASTLCAVDVPGNEIERAAARLQPLSGVTHCYERQGSPNLWFTMTAPAERLDRELLRIGELVKPFKVLNLPALRRFKVEVVLDAASGNDESVKAGAVRSHTGAPANYSEREKAIVRKIQGNISLSEEPLTAVAGELKWDAEAFLGRLCEWKQAGILRRIAFILRHREAGFVANGMCVWPVAPDDVVRAGVILAGFPEVTHCYERPSSPSIPFNLYAMIHAREQGTAEDTFRRMSERAKLAGGRMLISVREFKKSSPVFFMEDAYQCEVAQV
jgi:siroheme decarboxylase